MNKSAGLVLYVVTASAAFMLCVLCIALPVIQWSSIAENAYIRWAAGIAALAIGICKLTFFPISAECFKHRHRLAGVLLLVFALISLWLSVNASRDLLSNIEREKIQSELVKNLDVKLAQNALNDINADITNLNALLAADTANNYRERAYAQRQKLEKLREKRSEIERSVKQASLSAPEAQQWVFGSSVSFAKAGINLTVSAATVSATSLHLLCVFSLLAVTTWWPFPSRNHAIKNAVVENTVELDKHKVKHQQEEKHKRVKKRKDETQGLIQEAVQEAALPLTQQVKQECSALNAGQKILYKKIVSGVYGNKIIMRNIIQSGALTGGFKAVKPVFAQLEQDKKIIKVTRGYELIQQTI